MKEFLKKYLLIAILFLVGTVLFFLSGLSPILMTISMVLYFVAFLILAIRFRKKYKEKQEYDSSADYFDASKFDYEEEVYYIGSGDRKRSEIKGKFGEMQARVPFLICLFVSIACIFMAGYSVFKMFF